MESYTILWNPIQSIQSRSPVQSYGITALPLLLQIRPGCGVFKTQGDDLPARMI